MCAGNGNTSLYKMDSNVIDFSLYIATYVKTTDRDQNSLHIYLANYRILRILTQNILMK